MNSRFSVGDMFYFPPNRAWGIVTRTHEDDAGCFQFLDYVLMSPTHSDPGGDMRMMPKSDPASKFLNAIAKTQLFHYPVCKGNNDE